MYVNKCIKCGAEFETKNPKRVICPDCLYADKSTETKEQHEQDTQLKSYSSYPPEERRESQPRRYDNNRYDNNRNYRPHNNSYNNSYGNNNNNRRYDNRSDRGGFNRQGRFNNNYNNNNSGGYNNNRFQGYNNQGNRYNNPQRRNNNRFQQGGGRRPMPQQRKQAKPLLVSKEQLEKIEAIYKTMLPLPNPDAHEIIGTHLEIEPRKVFFGINLVRQKLMLPKLPYPKRKLAVTPDQMTAVKSLYAPLLPLPPIGCHKIIAAQLKVDEWRVHVAIKLIRAQMGLDRWNEDRPDKPADYLVSKYPKKEGEAGKSAAADENTAPPDTENNGDKDEKPAKTAAKKKSSKTNDSTVKEPAKRGRKKKEDTSPEVSEEKENAEEEDLKEEDAKPKKRGRKPKKTEDE